jgi:alkaline phosphatase
MKHSMRIFTLLLILTGAIMIITACGTTKPEKPAAKNIIFLIGDGMGLQQMHAAYVVNGGSLAIERASHVGLQKTHAANKYITDSAASGTALACGKKTNSGMIGMDSAKNHLESILKIAERNGMATGLVSSSSITHATPASFIANQVSRNDYEAIAADFLKTDIDLFIGGGLEHFTQRADGRDLTEELRQMGYTVTTTLQDAMDHPSGKLAAFTAPVHNPNILKGREDMLPRSTEKALELLSQNDNGFFIMIEGSQIDWGGHANDQDYVITETLDFDATVKVAMDFAEKNGETLVVVTADHETGGMVVLKGNYETRTVETTFTTGGHTGIMIPVYAYGPGAELFTGIYDNTDFKDKFLNVLGLDRMDQ